MMQLLRDNATTPLRYNETLQSPNFNYVRHGTNEVHQVLLFTRNVLVCSTHCCDACRFGSTIRAAY